MVNILIIKKSRPVFVRSCKWKPLLVQAFCPLHDICVISKHFLPLFNRVYSNCDNNWIWLQVAFNFPQLISRYDKVSS